jgi:hypothetical protein
MASGDLPGVSTPAATGGGLGGEGTTSGCTVIQELYIKAGDLAKAKAAYQGFPTVSNDADPDIPILKQANRIRQVTWSATRRARDAV